MDDVKFADGQVLVRLTDDELMHAKYVAMQWERNAKKYGRRDAYGAERENSTKYNRTGTIGEKVVSKALGIPWDGGEFRGDDVGPHQVRSTNHAHGCLILHGEDADDKRFYLVTGSGSVYVVRGWILGSDGKRDEFWRPKSFKIRNGAWFVPQRALNPVEDPNDLQRTQHTSMHMRD